MKRNKRGGLRLSIVYADSDFSKPYCSKCFFGYWGEDLCMDACKDFERVTGTRRFWFERDEGKV